jgi:hypothetical protein
VSKAQVDVLEIVDVDEEHGIAATGVPGGRAKQFLQPAFEQRAIAKPGERVEERGAAQSFLHVDQGGFAEGQFVAGGSAV